MIIIIKSHLFFLNYDGNVIFCEVTGRRLNREVELGIEVPRVYKFYERQSHINKHRPYHPVQLSTQKCVSGHDRVAAVTALWVTLCIAYIYIGWAFGSYLTDRIKAGDRPNEVTVNRSHCTVFETVTHAVADQQACSKHALAIHSCISYRNMTTL